MSESEVAVEDEKKPWVYKAAIVALPVGLALSAMIAIGLKVSQGEKTGMEGVTYVASDFEVANLRDAVEKIEGPIGVRNFETEAGQKAMGRMVSFVTGSLSSINLGYRVQSDSGEEMAGRIWKNYWVDSSDDEGDGDLLVWTTYSEEDDSASVAALLSVAEWMRGREFERRVRIGFLWREEAVAEVGGTLNEKKSRCFFEVTELGQGSSGLDEAGSPASGNVSFENFTYSGGEGERSEADWKMTLAWEAFEGQVWELCEKISEKAGERVVFEK